MPNHRMPFAGMLRRQAVRRVPRARSFSTPQRSALSELDVQHLASIVGPSNAVTDADALEQYNTDWMRKYRGNSKLALRPSSTAEVSAILAHCNERRIPVVPQGGNTGLVGGSAPRHQARRCFPRLV